MTDLSIQSRNNGPNGAAFAGGESEGDFGAFVENLLDIVNPLQHLPIVSTLYRSLTGDDISGPARLVGGALYGGPLGVVSAAVNLAVVDSTGNDIGEHLLALVSGEDLAPDMQLASADGFVPVTAKAEPVFTAYGDANAMTPDYVYWDITPRRPDNAPHRQSATAPQASTPMPTETANAAAAGTLEAPVAGVTGLRQIAGQTTEPLTGPITGPIAGPGQISDSKPDNAPGTTPEAVSAAATAALPARSAWLGAALADAEQEQVIEALAMEGMARQKLAGYEQTGQEQAAGATANAFRPETPPLKEAPAWLATAMGQALDKYQALAISRNLSAAADDEAGNDEEPRQ